MNHPQRIGYRFDLPDGSQKSMDFTFGAADFRLANAPPAEPPFWTDLKFNQCANCPLNAAEHPHCPAALQMASAIGGMAIGGMWFQPHMIAEARLLPTRRGDVNLENIQKVISGMFGVVNEPGGTGGRARLPGIEVCGKTGTAQLASNDLLKGTSYGLTHKDNAWFVGFAPRDNPEIVVAALFESGEHGQLAAPIVRDVLKAYFDKKARLAQPQPQIARVPTDLLHAPPLLPPSSASASASSAAANQ